MPAMVNREALQQRIQLLLSWREQAGKLVRQAKPGAASGKRRFAAHARQADFYLKRAVDEHHGLIEKLGLELQMALSETARIAKRAESGHIRPADAEMATAEIERRVNRIRGEITSYNTLLRAKRSSDAGGFIDLPIDDYAPRLGIPPLARRRPGWELRHYMTILIIAIISMAGGYAYYNQAVATTLTCTATYHRAPGECIVLNLNNQGLDVAQVHVPWPNPVPEGLDESHCGFAVFARKEGGTEFQYLPTFPEDWQYNGAPLTGLEALPVPSGVSDNFRLDVSSLRGRIKELSGLRVDTTDSAGVTLCSQEWEALPEPEPAAAP